MNIKKTVWNKVKIISTIGPSSSKPAVLRKMIAGGMDIARLNFSHGSINSHLEYINTIREAFRSENMQSAILQDLPGPKLRIGKLYKDELKLNQGDIVKLKAQRISNESDIIPFPQIEIFNSLKKGSEIFLSDGLLGIKILKTDGRQIKCEALNSAVIRSGCGVNLPRIEMPFGAFTRKDARYLKFGLKADIDFIGVSFVSKAADLIRVKKAIRNSNSSPLIIAKIERAQALDNLNEIIKQADGVMVARGDLAVELSPEKVPFAQKEIIKECQCQGKPSIVATQMLESMIDNPRPTRAELTDIANASLDGADAVMLSGETAIGKYPVEAVQIMSDVLNEAEKHILPKNVCQCIKMGKTAVSVASAAVELAKQLNVKAIVIPTFTGETMKCISHLRPQCPIISVCNSADLGKFSLLWGVKTYPLPSAMPKNLEDIFSLSRKAVLKSFPSIKNGSIVIACSMPYKKYPYNRIAASFKL